MKHSVIIVAALCGMLHASDKSAVSVSLTGTVKDSAGAPLDSVTLTLAKIKNLSAKTNATGAFTLTNITGVNVPENRAASYGISFRNNAIVFTPGSGRVSGTLSLNSIDGKRIAAVPPDNLRAGQQRLALPTLSPGMYLLAGTVDGRSFTRSLVYSGNDFTGRDATTAADGDSPFSLGKRTSSSIADTLIASKEGYDTGTTALTSYTKDGIAIVLKKKGAGGFTITSTAFIEGDEMPDKYTCQGKSMGGEITPPLAWSGIPEGAKSLALFFKDLTAAAGSQPSMGYHWGMWNIPVTVTKLPEGLGATSPSPEMGGAEQKSAYSAAGNKFFGPCPDYQKKGGIKDTYKISLYAFKNEKITPPTTDLVKMAKYFEDNAFDSTGISVWSDAQPK